MIEHYRKFMRLRMMRDQDASPLVLGGSWEGRRPRRPGIWAAALPRNPSGNRERLFGTP